MGILLWIAMGLFAGVLAKWIMPGTDPGGIIATMLIGIGGAIVGGMIGTALGFGSVTGFDVRSTRNSGGFELIISAERKNMRKIRFVII